MPSVLLWPFCVIDYKEINRRLRGKEFQAKLFLHCGEDGRIGDVAVRQIGRRPVQREVISPCQASLIDNGTIRSLPSAIGAIQKVGELLHGCVPKVRAARREVETELGGVGRLEFWRPLCGDQFVCWLVSLFEVSSQLKCFREKCAQHLFRCAVKGFLIFGRPGWQLRCEIPEISSKPGWSAGHSP